MIPVRSAAACTPLVRAGGRGRATRTASSLQVNAQGVLRGQWRDLHSSALWLMSGAINERSPGGDVMRGSGWRSRRAGTRCAVLVS